MKRVFAVLALFFLAAFLTFAGGEKEKAGAAAKEYNWKLASAEVEGDFMTAWAKNFAQEMEKWSNGKIKIEVYPYGTLGQEKDINELCQTNTVQFVFSDYGWLAGFVPQIQVFGLDYLWPRDKAYEVFAEVMTNGKTVKLLESKFREKKLQPLAYYTESWMHWTSKKPLKTPADMKGLKMRVMASKLLVTQYNAYGCSTTPMDFGEVYNGLQMGLIDGQVNPVFAIHSMKFFEVQDYITNPYSSLFVAVPCMNRDLYDSLPKDIQEKINKTWKDSLMASIKWVDKLNEDSKQAILKSKPKIQFYDFTKEETQPFRELVRKVYPEFVKLGGEGSQEILNALLADIEQAKAKLGVK